METKFRAFQLDTDGSSFSFFKPDTYTLVEARIPKGGIQVLVNDLKFHNKSKIDLLHITSWDKDHCNYEDLIAILNQLRPSLIEVPDYIPDTDNGKLCQKTIHGYEIVHEKYKPNVRIVTHKYIDELRGATAKGSTDIIYKSKSDTDKKNDMSLIRFFRSEGCNVLSLGDCECSTIAEGITFETSFVRTEVDILVLPHHGADNGFITGDFLDKVKPKIAISTSNFGNRFDHPKEEIRKLLYERDIKLYTTKTGDVFVIHNKGEKTSKVYNMMSDNEKISSEFTFTTKRYL
jgi:competence protein ComEC